MTTHGSKVPDSERGREQRAFARIPLRLDVEVANANGRLWMGRTRDFCLGGMFVEWRDDPGATLASEAFETDDTLTVMFRIEEADGVRGYQLSGRVARRFDAGVGVAFSTPDTATLLVLQGLSEEQRSRTETSDSEVAPDEATAAIERCVEALNLAFEPLLSAFFHATSEGLMVAARETRSSTAQTIYFDALNAFERSQGDIRGTTFELLEQHFRELGMPLVAVEKPEEESSGFGLSLVDKDEFEDLLRLSEIVSKAESAFESDLISLNARLSQLSTVRIDNETNPIGPVGVFHAVRRAIKTLDLERAPAEVAYDALESVGLSALRAGLQKVDKLLEDAGIEAKFGLDAAASQSRDARKERAAKNPTPSGSGSEGPEQQVEPAADAPASNDVDLLSQDQFGGPGYVEPQMPSGEFARVDGTPPPQLDIDTVPLPHADSSGVAGDAPRAPSSMPGAGTATPPAGTVPSGRVTPGQVSPRAQSPETDGGEPITASGGATPGTAPEQSARAVRPAGAADFDAFASDFAIDGNSGGRAEGQSLPASGAFASSASSVPRGARRGVGPRMVAPAVAVQATKNLLNLRRQALALPSGVAGEHDVVYEAEQVIEALDSASVPLAGREQVSLRERILANLDEQHGVSGESTLGEEGRYFEHAGALSDELADAIDMAEDFLIALKEDRVIDDHARTAIERLKQPIQSRLIVEPAFFAEREHPVRGFLNFLADFDRDEATAKDGAIVSSLDSVLKRVEEDGASDPELFSVAGSFLSGVVEEQIARVNSRRDEVVAGQERQQEFLRSRGITSPGQGAAVDDGSGRSREWAIWLERARELAVGTLLDLRTDSEHPSQRLHLCWIGGNLSAFVFVNRAGFKAATLSLPELAMYMRRGFASVVEGAEHPLVDRCLRTVLHRVHGRIEQQASSDNATGLGNRKRLLRAIPSAVALAENEDWKLSVCALRLLRVGDSDADKEPDDEARFWQRARRRSLADIRRHLTEHCELFQYDEQTFVILAGNASERRAAEMLKWICDDVAGKEVPGLQATESIDAAGAVSELANVPAQIDEWLNALVEQIHRKPADDGTRTKVETVEVDAGEAAPATDVDWASLINRTLGEDRIQLRCQRITPVDANTNGREARPYFEVFLGLVDESGVPVDAGEFVRAVNYYNQGAALDRWVIRNALSWMKDNRRFVRRSGGIMVKVMGATLEDSDLIEYLVESLTESGVAPAKLLFELTEEDALQYQDQLASVLRTLGEFGCRFVLNKFGAGASGAKLLSAFDFALVKLDGELVRSCARSTTDQAIVASLVELAGASDFATVAEFVEDAETMEILGRLSVTLAQGNHIEAPGYLTELDSDAAPSLKALSEAPPAAVSRASASPQQSSQSGPEQTPNAEIVIESDASTEEATQLLVRDDAAASSEDENDDSDRTLSL